jgi:hypothetical protein
VLGFAQDVVYYLIIFSQHQEQMMSMGSQNHRSLLFMMKLMVWHFVSDTHKVMTALIALMLPSKCCCRVFLAISWIHAMFPCLCKIPLLVVCEALELESKSSSLAQEEKVVPGWFRAAAGSNHTRLWFCVIPV